MTLQDRLDAIRAAPPGPQVGAFFDYDGTVISGYSAAAFFSHRFRAREVGLTELAQTMWAGLRGVETESDFVALMSLGLKPWQGKREEELSQLGDRLFKQAIASRLHREVWELVQAHHAQGHTVVLASSATPFQAEPMGRALEAHHVLCTRLEVEDDVLTGRVDGECLWGPAKARAVAQLAGAEGIELDASFAYSNGTEDVPLLTSVGHPIVVEPEDGLAAVAADRGWPVLRCDRRATPALADVVRTVGFYGAFGAAFGAGLGLGALNRSRPQVVDITTSVGADLGLALAGVDIDVVSGAEHLWAARPCVFVFNHQSKIDPVVVMKLLRQRWTGVAKKEARNIPGFGQLFQLAGVAFVDRGNTQQALEVLAPAVRKIRDEGYSLALSPEGTRSPTPRLGPFKKGAFHIAMQAGVPIVPVVLRGAGDVMWRGAQTIRPGVIEVAVLPPVATDGWSVASLDQHVALVRDQFVLTLARWPQHRVVPALEGSRP